MDKFDEDIKNAMEPKEPSSDFVDTTMQVVKKRRGGASHLKSWKVWLPILSGGVVVVVIVLLLIPGSHLPASTKVALNTPLSNPSNTSKPSASSTPVTSNSIAPGTDNATLTSDLNDVGNSINQENADQNNANSGLNDSQQEVTIPTD